MKQDLERPTQAVILAGGQGTRLKPLTDIVPKPMIRFHGKPFLEYVLAQIREQGFTKVLLLLGYLPDVLQKYFGDGSKFGLQITYAVTSVDDDTGRRMKRAEDHIDPLFFFMYCDNYLPFRFDAMWEQFCASDVLAQLTLYRNRDKYTKDNCSVDGEGMITTYDKSRTMPGMQGVDLGYAIMRKEILGLLPSNDNINFEAVVYPELVRQRKLGAHITDHLYYSVGDWKRLPITEKFLARQPVILLDRDGVLNVRPPKAEYVTTWSGFEWLPGAKEALRLLHVAGYRVILISNQSGIARGKMTLDDVYDIHRRMCAEVEGAGGSIAAVYFCPHGWDEGCACRKPKAGMLHQAQRDFCMDLSRTFFIGDDERDEAAGRLAGCMTRLVTAHQSLLTLVQEHILV